MNESWGLYLIFNYEILLWCLGISVVLVFLHDLIDCHERKLREDQNRVNGKDEH